MVDNLNKWWVGMGVTRHVYGERNMFSTYVPIKGRNLIMGDSATSRVVGIGKVVLKMTSEKNLFSRMCYIKNGFKLVFESDKFVLMKNGMYVGKWYMTNDLFKMNVMTIKRYFNNNKASTYIYMIESFTLWHDSIDFKHKCEVCGNQDG
ncbi:hypothetical protein AAG906_022601 [Vitis piasezkii]